MFAHLRNTLLKPHPDAGSFLLRAGLAIIFIYHGYLKLAMGGGSQWSDTLPKAQQLAVAWGETVCGWALLVGLLSRLAAVGVAVIMVGAITLQTGRFDFVYIASYGGRDPGHWPTGSEYNFAIIVMCLAVVVLGSGRLSLDHLIFGRRKADPTA